MYGYLYKGFKLEYFWWDIIDSLRKLAVVLVGVFLPTAGVVTQTTTVVIACLLVLCLQMKYVPLFGFPASLPTSVSPRDRKETEAT